MIYDRKTNLCFIHLHKCGGKTIRTLLWTGSVTLGAHEFMELRGDKYEFSMLNPAHRDAAYPNGREVLGTLVDETAAVDLCEMLWGHNGVNNFPADMMLPLEIFISARDMVDTYCSKFSFELKNAGIDAYDMYLDDKFKEMVRCGTDYSHYKAHPSWPIKNQFESWDWFPQEILDFNCGWFSSMLLYQTCILENDLGIDIRDYSCPVEYWSDANMVDHVVRLDNLAHDLNKIEKIGFVIQPKAQEYTANSSNLTTVFHNLIEPETKQLINEKEKLLQLVYEGKLNHKLRPARENGS